VRVASPLLCRSSTAINAICIASAMLLSFTFKITDKQNVVYCREDTVASKWNMFQFKGSPYSSLFDRFLFPYSPQSDCGDGAIDNVETARKLLRTRPQRNDLIFFAKMRVKFHPQPGIRRIRE